MVERRCSGNIPELTTNTLLRSSGPVPNARLVGISNAAAPAKATNMTRMIPPRAGLRSHECATSMIIRSTTAPFRVPESCLSDETGTRADAGTLPVLAAISFSASPRTWLDAVVNQVAESRGRISELPGCGHPDGARRQRVRRLDVLIAATAAKVIRTVQDGM